ncbi:hypothetical protein AWB78_08417 [Caballeronia calidae]|uniref:Uncharacterized protein n=1 Tax=Caballeronia calidae TaxID=1777139 RepID=A0A158EJM3_9BURK|nr:hypothetical protein AWB78_08417 [Caballeronia calidae]
MFYGARWLWLNSGYLGRQMTAEGSNMRMSKPSGASGKCAIDPGKGAQQEINGHK